jgi:beta-phosphoglucomutase-like phosphatase (HAD superfamily)
MKTLLICLSCSAWLSFLSGHDLPKVTIIADDPHLCMGKPVPDLFPLIAECLGYSASHCVIIEDLPNGIKAGVAASAIVITVCISHLHEQVEAYGMHFVMKSVCCEEIEMDGGTCLIFTVKH